MADTDSTKDRKTKAAQKTIKNSSQREKQRRAITGQHSEQQQLKRLLSMAIECEKKLTGCSIFEFDHNGQVDELAPEELERLLLEGVIDWMLVADEDDHRKAKALELDPRTRSYLAQHIEAWKPFFQSVRADKAPQSAEFKTKVREPLLASRALSALPPDQPEESSEQDAFDLFFSEYWGQLWATDTKLQTIRRRLLKQYDKELEAEREWIQWQLSKGKKDRWPPNWILNDPEIMENLNRKGCKHFFNLVELLWASRIHWKESEALAERKGWPGGLALFERDDAGVASKLQIKQPTVVHHYMKELERCGIIKRMGKRGEAGRGGFVYAIGTWNHKGSISKPDKFLKDTPEWRAVLREFDPIRFAKSQI